MNDRLMASRIRESVGELACFFSVISVPPWLFFSPQKHGGHGEIRASIVAPDSRRRGQSRLFCRQAVSSPLRRVPPNHQVETNRCQASRLRSWPVIGDSFPDCHGALTAAVAHLKRSEDSRVPALQGSSGHRSSDVKGIGFCSAPSASLREELSPGESWSALTFWTGSRGRGCLDRCGMTGTCIGVEWRLCRLRTRRWRRTAAQPLRLELG